jgi:hypothetical protein
MLVGTTKENASPNPSTHQNGGPAEHQLHNHNKPSGMETNRAKKKEELKPDAGVELEKDVSGNF